MLNVLVLLYFLYFLYLKIFALFPFTHNNIKRIGDKGPLVVSMKISLCTRHASISPLYRSQWEYRVHFIFIPVLTLVKIRQVSEKERYF